MRSRAIIGSLAVAVFAALAWHLQRDANTRSESSAAPIETIADTAARPVPRSSELPDTPLRAAHPIAAQPVAAAAQAPRPEPAPLAGATPTTPMADLIGSHGDVPPGLVKQESEFSVEPIDAEWAPGVQAGILGELAQIPKLEVINMDVECRSTMCRLQLVQPASAATAPHLKELLESRGFVEPLWIITMREPSGLVRSVVYWPRYSIVPQVHY